MAGRHSFAELRARMSPEAQVKAQAEAQRLGEEMDLAEVRRALKLSQEEIGQTLQIKQGSVAKIERRADMYVSTLRRFIEAMGGELEIVARFPDHAVKIKNFADLNEKERARHLHQNRRSGSAFCKTHGIDDKRGHDKSMSLPFQLRPYRAEDEDAAIALWLETWQQAYPAIDFAARVGWWRERWRHELVPNASILLAEQEDALIGFVTIDPAGYLDQLVVAPDHWGSVLATALLDRAKQLSPGEITLLVNADNARAIRFYQRNGFVHAGEDVNPTSGRPVLRMVWKQ